MRIDMGKPKIDYAKLPAIYRKLLEQEIVSVDAGWRVFQINLAKHLYEGLDKATELQTLTRLQSPWIWIYLTILHTKL